ncbi:hypothetical protein PIB30_100995 [Stylosanthes scabra]|uniref:Uncharacterized protein n=1 Tax=Stylosanthes scabra TaxID=79078 RepID=A0ABU6VXQ9_9FABA|nr:hypothetical protein [Stylosanthes scabra]
MVLVIVGTCNAIRIDKMQDQEPGTKVEMEVVITTTPAVENSPKKSGTMGISPKKKSHRLFLVYDFTAQERCKNNTLTGDGDHNQGRGGE